MDMLKRRQFTNNFFLLFKRNAGIYLGSVEASLNVLVFVLRHYIFTVFGIC